MARLYTGSVVYVGETHYPSQEDGSADLSRPLTWVEGTTYRDQEPGDATHHEEHHEKHVELGMEGETFTLSPAEAEAVKELLTKLRGEE